jgi:uncharacterized protein (TIGR03086 family)
MDYIEALEISWAQGAALVDGLRYEDLDAPTPCAGWGIRELLNHVLGETLMMTLANRGQATGLDHGDLVGDGSDLADTWQTTARENVESWRDGDLAGERTYPYGTFPADVAVVINLGEVLLHNWDLAHATGRNYVLDDELATPVHDLYTSVPLDEKRAHGVFGPDLGAAPGAPVGDRLLALLGRRVATGPEGTAVARGGQAETVRLGTATLSLLLDASATGGALSAHRGELRAGSVGARPHFHTSCSEALYVLDGTLEVLAGEQIVVATKGDLLVVPPRTPHAFAAGAGADADFLALVTPGIDRFEGFRQLAATMSGAVNTARAGSDSAADYDNHPAYSSVWENRS